MLVTNKFTLDTGCEEFMPKGFLVVLADDAYAFMVMWETMALSSFFLVIAHHRDGQIRRAGYL